MLCEEGDGAAIDKTEFTYTAAVDREIPEMAGLPDVVACNSK
jgi:hypothetical protein